MQLALKHGDNWKLIADELNMRDKRKAILEFVRLSLTEVNDFSLPNKK